VPCQIVIATQEEQAVAFKAINASTTPISQMALHAAALVANEPAAIQIAHVCACADVELLRYPIAVNKQAKRWPPARLPDAWSDMARRH
jgi:hypothetical protein